MTAPKLKPCPFCRKRPDCAVQLRDTYAQVVCGCGAMGPACPTEAEAIAIWNTRTPDPDAILAPEMAVYTVEDGMEAAGPFTPVKPPVEYVRADLVPDPAAIREAALREALVALRGAGAYGRTPTQKAAATEQYMLDRDAILALIEKGPKE